METTTRKHWKKINAAALRGDAAAQWEVGYFHQWGAKAPDGKVLAAANCTTALQWYQASAEQGLACAQNTLSTLLSSNEAIEPNFPLAIEWAKKAVTQGDASAAFNLGTIYRDLEKPKKAFRWYQRAGAMGDNDAFLTIGLCHLFGLGTKQNLDAALAAFERIIARHKAACCQRSQENAQYWTAVAHLIHGPKTKRTLAQTRSLLEAAHADDDHEQANEILHIVGKSGHLAGLRPSLNGI